MQTVGELIAKHQPEVLRSWTEAVQRSVSAEGLSQPELLGLMPEYLSLLGRVGVEETPRLSDAQKDLIERHLSNRLRQGFELNEILGEFAVVGRCLSGLLETERAEGRPPVAAVTHLFAELYLTSLAVTQIFNEHLLEDEQTEKRYGKLLKNLGSGPPGTQEPLRTSLVEALTLVMRAMGAQTAALLLFDVATRRLVMSASVGDVDERLEQYVSALDPGSLVGKIAAAERGIPLVADALTTELAVSEELRQSGIRSLLGVPLSAHHLLQGAIYIGLRERRSFTASERRRLESLGETLAVYVENTQLHAALGRKLDELRAEGALRERFISVLMHDLTGPLTNAKLQAQRLLRKEAGRDPRTSANRIVRSLDRMEAMVGDLLDTHRIRAGQRLPMRIEDCNLSQVVHDVVEELRGLHGDRFVVRMANDVRGMWSADQLRRAVWNLLDNAIKHGAPGAPVTITVKKSVEGARLHVHNDGPAIAAEEQARLFQPFARGRASNDAHPPGWGLGLTLVWGCAEAHGGGITVESLPDEGTTFTLAIPIDASPYTD